MRRFASVLVAGLLLWGGSASAYTLLGSTPAPVSGVPAPAAAAGFTQQVINADFSQSSYANLANWLFNCGGSLPGWSWSVATPGAVNPAPCTRIDLENDPTINKQVLHLQFLPADGIGQFQLAYPGVPFGQGNNNNDFPIEFYLQITFRYSTSSVTQGMPFLNIGGGDHVVGGGHNDWIEPDYWETQTDTNSGGGYLIGDSFLGYCSGNICAGSNPTLDGLHVDVTQYHTLGILFTSDGNTAYWKCYYVDAGINTATAYGCGNIPASGYAPFPTAINIHDYMVRFGLGTNTSIPNPMDEYIQNIQVWTCPGGYGTTQTCAGTMITH